jgi:hypothetical protein
MGRSWSTCGEMRNVYNILIRKFQRKRSPWRPRYRWEVNINIKIYKTGYVAVNWIHVAEDRV